MSRSKYSEHITLDIILAYSPGIPTQSTSSQSASFPISFYFPGDSVLLTQLSASPLIHSDSTFKCFQNNKLTKIVLSPSDIISTDSKILFNTLTPDLISSISTSSEILIGIMDYPKTSYPEIEKAVLILIKGIEFLITKKFECKITIATVNYFYKELENWVRNRALAKKETYFLNKDMKFELYDKVNCKFCRETPTEAYTTECCPSTLFCENCKKIMKNCFSCGNTPVHFFKEPFYNQFLKDIDYKCKCNKIVKCGTIKQHSFCCELTAFKCNSRTQCSFEGTQVELVVHAIKEHFVEFDSSKPEIQIEDHEFQQECPSCMNYNHGQCPNCPQFQRFEEILEILQI